ncbi:GAF domain-containing protein [Streptomyces sp. NPDC007875]|uniref:GAF domain-containing protein n=1 Tax=Streptomyces sp. NPDC007875 TaxID=3364783 RepID=UPI00367F377F
MVLAGADLLDRVQAAAQQAGELSPAREAAVGCHCAAVAEVPGLTEQLVRYAVLADRQAGVGWARIGATFGISAEAARRRFGRVRQVAEEGQGTRDDATPAAGSGMELLDAFLCTAVREAGASAGLVYLLPPDGQVLRLAMVTGMPPKIAELWERLPLPPSGPVADAVRERRLVWLASQAELVRRYPRAALVWPYPVALAAAPVTSGTTAWGGLVLMWPGPHRPQLSAHERAVIGSTCDRVGAFLRHAAADRHPIAPEEPHVAAPPRAWAAAPVQAQAAVDFADRLSEGCCALDVAGSPSTTPPAFVRWACARPHGGRGFGRAFRVALECGAVGRDGRRTRACRPA